MEDRIMVTRIQSALDKHKDLIVSELSDDIIDNLHVKNVISKDDMDCLIRLDTKSALLKLLHYLDEKSLPQLTIFLCILEEHNTDLHRKIKTSIEASEVSTWKAVKNALRSLYPVFIESLKVNDIVPKMYAGHVMTWEESDRVGRLADSEKQTQANKAFFHYLRDKPDETQALGVFLQCLQVKQPSLFEMISEEVEKLGVTSLNEALVTPEEPDTTVKQKPINGNTPVKSIEDQAATTCQAMPGPATHGTIHVSEGKSAAECLQDKDFCNVFTIVPIGESKAGKTSLMRTIMRDKSYLTKEGDCTIVADPLRWIPHDQQDIVFTINDVGGQDTYKSTTPCFQVNSPSCLNVLCHDITSIKYGSTFYWLKATQTNAYESRTVVILTKTDQTEIDILQSERKQKFVKKFSALLDKEIELTEEIRAKCDLLSFNWDIYTKHLKNYRAVKQQVNSKELLLVSCLPGWEESVANVKSLLLRFAKEQGNKLILRRIDKDLFLQIGELGIKPPMLEERKKSEAEYMHQQFITITEVMCFFEPILQRHKIKAENSVKVTKKTLATLGQKGLLVYFADDKILEDIIFNITTLVHILQCIFNHDIESFLKFETLDSCMRTKLYDDNQERFEEDMLCLRQHGIISMSLLNLLLQKNKCLVEGNVVMQLLSELDVGIPFDELDESERKIFIPFFIKKVIAPTSVAKMKQDILKCQEQVLSLHTIVKGNLPPAFFHQLLVKVQRNLGMCHYFQKDNLTWSRGLRATLGQCQAKLLMLYNNDNEIEFLIQSDISRPKGHHVMWEYILLIDSQSKDIKIARFPGLPLSYVLTCTCCMIAGEKSPDTWLVERLLKSTAIETFTCKNSHVVNAALLRPLSEEESHSKSYLAASHVFLKRVITDHKLSLADADLPITFADTVQEDPLKEETKCKVSHQGFFQKFRKRTGHLFKHKKVSKGWKGKHNNMGDYSLSVSINFYAESHHERTFDDDDVSTKVLRLEHPTLREFQNEIEIQMECSGELLEELVSTNLITAAQKESIARDGSHTGRARRILLHTDNFGVGGVEKLADALVHCKKPNKRRLGQQLHSSVSDCYHTLL